MTAHSTLDTISLASRSSITQVQWTTLFIERIYQMCNSAHPGMAIERDAVMHIKDTISQIVLEILEEKPTSVTEMDKSAQRLFPKSCQWSSKIVKEAWDTMHSAANSRKFHAARFGFGKPHELQSRMMAFIRETMGIREKERRDREKEKEVEKMAIYIIAVADGITEDILKWTGNYVKHIRDSEHKISLQNLKIALNADKALMELTSSLNNDEEETAAGGFLSNFYDYDLHDSEEEQEQSQQKSVTYESIAHEFLKEERLYLRELNQANVFRRRLESHLRDDDKCMVKKLFGNLPEIHELTLKMERTLEDSIEMSDAPCIGMGLWELAEAYEFDGYLSYVLREREEDQEQPLTTVIHTTISELLLSKEYANMFTSEERGYANSLDGPTFRLAVKYVLPTLLHAPILHFFRYIEYTNKLLRYSDSEEDRQELQNCKRYLTNVGSKLENICSQLMQLKDMLKADQASRNDSRISQLTRLQQIQRSIDGFVGNPIGKTCTELVKEGHLQMLRPTIPMAPDPSRKGRWTTHRHLFLFDQLLVMCKKHKTLKFKDRTAVQLMDIIDLDDTAALRHAFRLDIREKAGYSRSYTMICKNDEDKFSWMGGLVMVTTRSLLDRILNGYEKEEAKRIPLVTPAQDQYRFAEPDCEENISFEDYTSSSGIPVVKHGTILKLVERLTYHQYTDNKFVQTFLISYRSFCAPTELLELLIERFNVPVPSKLQQPEMRGGPLAGRYDTVQSHGLSNSFTISAFHEQSYQRFRKEYERPIQRRVLSVLHQWVKNHWYDFDSNSALLEAVEKFLTKSCETPGKLTNQHKKFCRNIAALVDKMVSKSASACEGHVNSAFDWDDVMSLASHVNIFQPKKPETVWHTAKKGDVGGYDLLTLHPLEIGRQLTLLHFDLYRAIKPIELVGAAWTKHDKYGKSPQLLKLTDHSTLLTYWVSRSIVETDSLEERVAIFSRVLEVMSVFEELHNFTGLVAFQSALNSACVHRLTSCWDRLDHEKQKCFDRFATLCEPRWNEMQKRLQSINPPCVPFFGHYLSNIFFFEAGNSTFVKSPNATSKEIHRSESMTEPGSPSYNQKRVLVSFLKCRRISDLIREIQMYQNQPYALHQEPSIRQFFESINPKSDFNNDGDALETYLYDRSLKIQPKDADKLPDVKSKRAAHVLKSPGIKPPKSNHYSSNTHNPQGYSTQTSTVPSTPSHDSGEGPRSASALFSSSHHSDDMTIDWNHHKYTGDAAPNPRRPMAPLPKLGQLQPPPLHPRKKAVPTLPPPAPIGPSSSQQAPPPLPIGQSAGQAPPPLHPRKSQPLSPLNLNKSPLTPKSARHSNEPSPRFVFPAMTFPSAPPPPTEGAPSPPLPAMSRASPPALPPRRSNETPAGGQEQLRVTIDRTGSESVSPTVCLSVPLPPALPPARGSHAHQTPPPRPPKTNRAGSSSPSVAASTAANGVIPSRATPPPLPPKTYKRKQSVSPTEHL